MIRCNVVGKGEMGSAVAIVFCCVGLGWVELGWAERCACIEVDIAFFEWDGGLYTALLALLFHLSFS